MKGVIYMSLFYDSFTCRYFVSDVNKLYCIENVLRLMLQKRKIVTVNNVYSLIGLDEIPGGDNYGWDVSDKDWDENKALWLYYNFFELFPMRDSKVTMLVLLGNERLKGSA